MTGVLTWLPDVLRDAGVDVYVMPGAATRSSRSSGLAVRGIVWHHTATGPNWSDGHVAALLRDGRRDLSGPLAQVGIERDGTWVIVALGRANHNGFGEWQNDSLGLEFYNSGVGEPWAPQQVHSGIVGTAACLKHLGKDIHAVKGHRETDPRRKIDPAGLSMSDIRRRIDAEMRHKPTPAPPIPEDPFMADIILSGADLERFVENTYAEASAPLDESGRAAWPPALAFDDDPKAVLNYIRDKLGLKTI